jgi:hypothetical protein
MTTVTKGDRVKLYFLEQGRLSLAFCISRSMSKYVYQIQGALQNAQGQLKGLRILVCDLLFIDMADVPVEILDHETAKYIQFRLNITEDSVNIQKLPISIQNKIRTPLGRWLDHWVLENFYGDTSNRKSTNA